MYKVIAATTMDELTKIVSSVTIDEHFTSPVKLNQAQPGRISTLPSKLRALLLRPFRAFKLRKATAQFAKGSKFTSANAFSALKSTGVPTHALLARQSNDNIKFFKEALRETQNGPIIREDEKTLMTALLNLDLICQHGTHHYYQILNSKTIASTTEIRRSQPDYKPTYSTAGNIAKLGNAGYLFFRVAGASANGRHTRYGPTRLFCQFDLLEQGGVISMHDQLLPFSKATEKTFRDGNRVLRTATTKVIQTTSKEKTMHDGIVYTFPSTDTKHKIIKDFLADNPTKITIPFQRELFYGRDCRLGIALSVIWQLRHLQASGFRETFLQDLNKATETEQTQILETLIRKLYRIEAKYPIGLNIIATPSDLDITCEDAIDTEKHHNFRVENPDGDGRYFSDLKLQGLDARVAYATERAEALDSELSVYRRQAKNPKLTEARRESAKTKVAELEKEHATYKDILSRINTQKETMITTICEATNTDTQDLNSLGVSKIECLHDDFLELMVTYPQFKDATLSSRHEKLIIIQEYWLDLLNEDYLTESLELEHLFNPELTVKKLDLITQSNLYDWVTEELCSLAELTTFSEADLAKLAEISDRNGMGQGMVDFDFSLRDLLTESDEALTYACDSDLEAIIIDTCPNWPDHLKEMVDDYGLQEEGFLEETLGEIHWQEFCNFMGWGEPDEEPEAPFEDY